MKIRVELQNRKSIAYCLAPEELTILLPVGIQSEHELDFLSKPKSPLTLNLKSQETPKEIFKELINNWTKKLEVNPLKVQLRRMRNKWASCSDNQIVIFNQALTLMPKEFTEYVICHELLHLKIPQHNRLFNSFLSALMPDWRERILRTVEYLKNQKRARIN